MWPCEKTMQCCKELDITWPEFGTVAHNSHQTQLHLGHKGYLYQLFHNEKQLKFGGHLFIALICTGNYKYHVARIFFCGGVIFVNLQTVLSLTCHCYNSYPARTVTNSNGPLSAVVSAPSFTWTSPLLLAILVHMPLTSTSITIIVHNLTKISIASISGINYSYALRLVNVNKWISKIHFREDF